MNPPVFGHGELRLVLLTLIAREPRHGYDLIHALNDHFEGDYSPSAGTIYPRLAKLQEEGLVTKTRDGRKTVYSITEAGLREVEERREDFERITTERTDTVRTVAQSARAGLAQARRGLREELEQIAAQARTAAEEALLRERAETEAQTAAKAAADAEAKVAAAEQAANERIAQAEQRDHTQTGASGDAADEAHGRASAADSAPTAEPGPTPDSDQASESGPAPESEQAPEPDPTVLRAQFVRRVDVALQQFRMELRQDAREANQLGSLDEDTVSELETQLRELRRRLGSLLRVHR